MALWCALLNEYEDWYEYNYNLNFLNNQLNFDNFINQKEELGLYTEGFKIYRIIDEKKWALARIKYGI